METLTDLKEISETYGEEFTALLTEVGVVVLNDYVWDRFGNPELSSTPDVMEISVKSLSPYPMFTTVFVVGEKQYDRENVSVEAGIGHPTEENNFYTLDVEVEQLAEKLLEATDVPFCGFSVKYDVKTLETVYTVTKA